MRTGVVGLLLLLASLAGAGPVEAALVPDYELDADIRAPRSGAAGNNSKFAVLTGVFDLVGPERGVISASRTRDVVLDGIERVEVLRTSGGRNPMPQASFEDVTIRVSDNATVIYFFADTTHEVDVTSDWAMVVPVDPPDNVGSFEYRASTSLAVVGGAAVRATMVGLTEAILGTNSEDARFTLVRDGETVASYDGEDWAFRVTGPVELSLEAKSVVVPFAREAKAILRPGSLALASERFDLNALADAYAQANPEADPDASFRIDPAVVEQFRDASAIFNGALLGNPPGSADVADQGPQPLGAFTIVRYRTMTLEPTDERGLVRLHASGPFVLVDDGLHTHKGAVGPIPFLSLILWILAGGAIALGFVVRPFVAAHPANAAWPVRRAALAFHILAAVLVFVAWDLETRAFLGSSILLVLGGDAATEGVAFTAVLGAQLLTLSLAWLFFGLPTRFLVNTALKLGQMRRARGVGRGVGHLAAWGLGASHFALLLTPFVGILIEGFAKFP